MAEAVRFEPIRGARVASYWASTGSGLNLGTLARLPLPSARFGFTAMHRPLTARELRAIADELDRLAGVFPTEHEVLISTYDHLTWAIDGLRRRSLTRRDIAEKFEDQQRLIRKALDVGELDWLAREGK